MIVREQENVFFYRTGGNKMFYFDIICADVVYPPGEKLVIFAPIKDFPDVYDVEHPSQT